MDLKKELQLKQEELKKMVEQSSQLQNALAQSNQNILMINGAIKLLEELINKETKL